MPQNSDAANRRILTAQIASDSVNINGVKLALYQNDHTPGRGDDSTAYTECNFDGYSASGAVTFGAPGTDVSGNALAVSDRKLYTCTGSSSPQTAYGVVIRGGDSAGTYVGASRFPTPIPIAGVGSFVALDLIQGYPVGAYFNVISPNGQQVSP